MIERDAHQTRSVAGQDRAALGSPGEFDWLFERRLVTFRAYAKLGSADRRFGR